MSESVVRVARLTPEQVQARRKAMDEDVWLFIKWVCGHGADDIERFHRPLAYLLAGDAVRLAASLNTYKSEVVSQIREDLERRGIDWNTKDGIAQLKNLLKRVNDRISRSMGKTSIGLDVVLWAASVDPNISIGIASKSDDAAWAMCETLGNVIRSDAYKLYYGDRLYPTDPEGYITKKWIRLNGRTVPTQDTIEARGVTSQWYSKHYHFIYCDDLASTEAKQGVATVEDAIRFMASLHGISISERWGGTRYVFNGTIQGPNDDNAKLCANPEFISTLIPIWTRADGAPWTLANMMDDGVPTLPELYDVEAIRAKRADTLANDSLGKISWIQNFLMCAHNAGSMQFTADLINKQKFQWISRAMSDGSTRREIRRYVFNEDGSPKINKDLGRRGDACGCRLSSCHDPNHEFVQFHPTAHPRNMGVDQAISTGGDDWGIGCTAIDPYGALYILRGEYGKGYWKMVPAIAAVFKRWGGFDSPVGRIGLESNTWQAMSTDWLKRDDSLQFLARRMEKLPPAQTAKVLRIMNDVYANLVMGTLWVDPEDSTFEDCALKYNASEPDSQWDDPLDCVAMSIQLHTRKASSLSDDDIQRYAQQQEREFYRDCDSVTGIDMTNDFVQAAIGF